MIPCRVHVDNPLGVSVQPIGGTLPSAARPPSLMTGMFVKVQVDARPPIPLVSLPPEAIQPGNQVWTVTAGRLKRKDVMVAHADSNVVIAYQQPGGLGAGDKVIVSPLPNPIEGLPVAEMGEGPGGAGKNARSSAGSTADPTRGATGGRS